MFCFNCGKEIDNQQKFCCYCGAENKNYITEKNDFIVTRDNEVSSPIKESQINTIFNRDVLTNYLNNLQTLEFAKHKLSKEEGNIQYCINSLGNPKYISPRNTISNYFGHIGGIVFMLVVFFIAMWIDSGLNGDGFFSIFDNLLGPIVSFVQVAAVIITIIIIGTIIYEQIEDSLRYKRESKEETDRLRRELVEKERLSEFLPIVKRDLKRTSEVLNEAYSINIIPAKYRNIYAAYFLYEYISTSTVSLSEALYHCDLDEISQKLSVVIEQQQEIIMQLAHSNALNEQKLEQNEEILKHAIAAENNTALAAQYSQVAAINSNTVATIQSYYFFKNGL